MAKFVEISELRLAIAENEDAEPYTDRFLNDMIDEKGSVSAAAASIWGHKAAAAATLVDVSESGSSRKLGDLYKNALAMQTKYEGLVLVETGGELVRRPRTRAIVRPT